MFSFTSSTVQRLVAALSAWRRQRQDRRQLMAMSEGELRDLGVGRGQIPWLLETPPDLAR